MDRNHFRLLGVLVLLLCCNANSGSLAHAQPSVTFGIGHVPEDSIQHKIFGEGGMVGFVTGKPIPKKTYTYELWPPRRVEPPREVKFQRLNLSFLVPVGEEWTQLDPSQTDPHACVVLRHDDPAYIAILSAVPVGVEAGVTNENLLAASQNYLRGQAQNVEASRTKKVKLHGMKSVWYTASATSDGSPVHYAAWMAAHNGYNYHLSVYGHHDDRRAVKAAMIKLAKGVEPLDPKRVAHSRGQQISSNRRR